MQQDPRGLAGPGSSSPPTTPIHFCIFLFLLLSNTKIPGTRSSSECGYALGFMCKDASHPVIGHTLFSCYPPHSYSFEAENFIFLFFKVAGTSQILTQKQNPAITGPEKFCVWLLTGKLAAVPLQTLVLHRQTVAMDADLHPQVLPCSSCLPAQARRVPPVHPT